VDVDGEVFQSEYLSPILTAEIDSLFLTKDEKGAPVFVRISTDGGANGTNYYRWMYNETWEVMADFYANARWGPNGTVIFHSMYTSENTYYCWGRDSSKVLLLGDTEKLSQNIVSRQKILEIPCDDDRLSILYHIEARQMQLREAAYRYFADLQERIERTGDLFSPILTAGLRGNIRCAKDPERLVVGYIEVATTTRKDLYVWEREGFYEVPATYWASLARRCTPSAWSTNRIFSIFSYKTSVVYDSRCVDCRERAHASKDKPQGWPTEHW
jgi:hypothetical protein